MVCLQEYTVEVKLLDMCWDLRRRFSDFRKLHSSLEGCLDEKGEWPWTGPAAASHLRRARGPCAPHQPPVRTAPAARGCARECGRAFAAPVGAKIELPAVPGRRLFGNMEPEFVTERLKALVRANLGGAHS